MSYQPPVILKILFQIFFFLYTSIQVNGQYLPEKIGRKATDLYTKGLQQAAEGNFKEGIVLLESAVKADNRFLEAYLSLGGIHGELKEYASAIKNYEIARSIDSVYFRDYALPYSINLAGAGNFEKALWAVNDFLSVGELNTSSRKAGEYRKRCYEFALSYASKKHLSAYLFEPKNLGDSINTEVSEYYPALTIDGNHLLFTRRVNHLNEDFYEAFQVDGRWTKSKNLAGNINSNLNEGAQNISQDGEWLIFTGCNFPDGFGSCDLYISYLTAEGWSTPENLGENINTEAWESAPSLSPDKRDLYFSSNRAGGYGQEDIYISHRLPNGTWTLPENAGPRINTAGNESSPFIHADNQTLYFTSNGLPGYGGDDLFMTKKNRNGWDTALNLGYPINTIENEGSLVVAGNGHTAYYASDRSDSRGRFDLYSFELREDIRPYRTLWVQGKVFDAKTKKGLPSAVELTDLSNQQLLSKVQTDETGNYLITLPVGKDYAFNVNRKGYLFYSGNFSLSTHPPDSTYHKDIALQPLSANLSMVLKNIFFDLNRFEIKPESMPELDNMVRMLRENPSLKISIEGHTDNSGSAADNVKLSNNRAAAVIKYLGSKGIDPGRLSSKGWGAEKPVAANTTEEGRAQNRRTELKVMKE